MWLLLRSGGQEEPLEKITAEEWDTGSGEDLSFVGGKMTQPLLSITIFLIL